MSVTEMNSPVRLDRLTKAELIEALQSQKTAAVESSNILQQQAHLLDLSYDAIFIWELGDGIRYWNLAAEELYGWTRDEALGRKSHELLNIIHPDGWTRIEEALLRDGHWYGELIHQGRDGRRFMVDSRHVLIREADGRNLVLETNRDLTTRKQAEAALCESQTRLEMLFQHTEDAILFVNDQARFVDANPSACRLTGFTRTELLQKTVWNLTPLLERERGTRLWGEFIRSGTLSGVYELLCKGGSVRTVELQAVANIQPGLHLSVLNDITDRKRAEQALRDSEARMGGIINSAMDAIISVNDQQQIVLFNRAAEKMFGYTAEAVLGSPLAQLIPTRFRAAHDQHIRRFGETGETTRAMGALSAVSGVRHSGEEFPIEASISQIEVEGQKYFTVILRDITERERAKERLIEQAALLDQSHEAILVRDLDGRIRYWSRGAERLYGWTAEEAIGRTARELHYSKQASPLAEATKLTVEHGEWNGELRHITKDGREVIVEGHWTLVRDAEGKPKNILAINTNVTEKKKLEANFLRAQRLESIGTLASGIAHDLNNVLSPILMGAQMLQMKLHDEQSQRLIGLMQANANRGAEMIRQVLSFAKGISGQRVVLQPKHLIREIVRIAEETFPKSVRIEQRLADDLWALNGDATQLHQVMLNLSVNARDAMPQGGTLTITAENRTLDKLYALMLKGAAPGNFVVITVTDTGVGISPENLDRIFDPFFTTKEPGQGTGLGLATVQGIATAHGGFITVESELGFGTKFSVYLPADEAARQQKARQSKPEMIAGAGELILVVDDEAAVREMTNVALEAFGYRVLTADNGATALGVFASHLNEISLVVTDLMMPVMDGTATIRALRKIKPDIRIIPTTGLADPARISELSRLNVEELLEKPFNAESLLNAVAKTLNKRPPSATNS
ncbi:MAG: PAS domain S-box protein [Acidobacteria bacterium]|nr:PAS domain S-box protein [Acidobacteriota bacterium]